MRRHADGRLYLFDLVSHLAYTDRAGGIDRGVMLQGTGRSGTTWLMEVFNAHRDHRVIFEPFASNKVRFARPLHPEPYIRPDDDDPATAAAVDRVLSGRYRTWWTDQHNRTLVCRKRLIKAIRAGMALGYIRRRHPGLPIVVLVRHPCACASSMAQLGYGEHAVDHVLGQPQLVADYLEPHVDRLWASTDDPIVMRVARWCVQHAVMFDQLLPGDVHLTFYEDLCDRPEPTLADACAHLGLPFDDAMRRMIDRPSRLSKDHSAIVHRRPLADAWRDRVSDTQLRRCHELMRAFGLGDLYDGSSRPNRQAADALLAQRPAAHRGAPA